MSERNTPEQEQQMAATIIDLYGQDYIEKYGKSLSGMGGAVLAICQLKQLRFDAKIQSARDYLRFDYRPELFEEFFIEEIEEIAFSRKSNETTTEQESHRQTIEAETRKKDDTK